MDCKKTLNFLARLYSSQLFIPDHTLIEFEAMLFYVFPKTGMVGIKKSYQFFRIGKINDVMRITGNHLLPNRLLDLLHNINHILIRHTWTTWQTKPLFEQRFAHAIHITRVILIYRL